MIHMQHNPPLNNIPVLPAELVAETTKSAVLAAWLEAQNTQSLWDDHALLVVIWRRDTLECLQTLHGGSTAGSLVWDHTTDGAPEHLGWRTVVPWTCKNRHVSLSARSRKDHFPSNKAR